MAKTTSSRPASRSRHVRFSTLLTLFLTLPPCAFVTLFFIGPDAPRWLAGTVIGGMIAASFGILFAMFDAKKVEMLAEAWGVSPEEVSAQLDTLFWGGGAPLGGRHLGRTASSELHRSPSSTSPPLPRTR